MACEDLAFGDKFLQKPPSTDVTIDTVYSTAEYARRVLWYSYEYLPYGHETSGYWTTDVVRLYRRADRPKSRLFGLFGCK